MTNQTLQPTQPPVPGSFVDALHRGGIQNDPNAPLGTINPTPGEVQPQLSQGGVTTHPPQPQPAQQTWNGMQQPISQQGVPGVGTANGGAAPTGLFNPEQMSIVQQSLKEREELVRSQTRRDLEAQQAIISRLQQENAHLASTNTDVQARLKALETQNLPQEEKQRLAFEELKKSNEALNGQLHQLEEQRRADLEAFNRQVELNRVTEYKNRRVSEMASFIEPELQDLVQGNTVEEVEASLTRAMQRSHALRSRMTQPMTVPAPSPAAPVMQPPMAQPSMPPPNLLMHPDTWHRLNQNTGVPQPQMQQPPQFGSFMPQPGYPPGTVPAPAMPQMGVGGGQPEAAQQAGFARQVAGMAGFEGVRPGGAYAQHRDAIFHTLTGEAPAQIRGRLGGGV